MLCFFEGGNKVMARTTITNDRVAIPQGNVVAGMVMFDPGSDGYPVLESDKGGYKPKPEAQPAPQKPTTAPVNQNADAAVLRDLPKPAAAPAPNSTSSGLAPIGGPSSLNAQVGLQPEKPAPVAVSKPQEPPFTVSKTRIFGGSVFDQNGKHTTVTGQADRTQIDAKVGLGTIKISNTEHDNVVDTTVKGKTTRQNRHTSDYQVEYEQKVKSNTTAYVSGRSSTTEVKDSGKTEYEKKDSVIRVAGGFRQTDNAGNGMEIKKSLWAYRDFGGSSTPVTALNASIGAYKSLTSANSPTKVTGFVDASSRLRLPDGGAATLGMGVYIGIKGVIPVFKNASLEIGVRGGVENSLNTLATRDFNYGGSGGSTNWSPQYDATVKFAYKF
jgi:hypothetical protein